PCEQPTVYAGENPMNRSRLFADGLVLVFLICVTGGGAAQSSRMQLEKGDDLRAAYANAADVVDGKRIAETTCAGCHGALGISRTPGTPHLAGQRPAYLYLELRAYQSGARADSAMSNTVKPLNDSALVKVAAYYASLEPAQPMAA